MTEILKNKGLLKKQPTKFSENIKTENADKY